MQEQEVGVPKPLGTPIIREGRATMRVRAWLSAVVAALLLAPVHPAHADNDGTLTITGSHTAYVWLVLSRTVTYDLSGSTIEYAGEYGGFALGADTPQVFSDYDLRGLPTLVGVSRSNGVLKPGRYKVRLFADGNPVTVRIPWSGPNGELRPTTPFSATVAGKRAPVATAFGTAGLAFPADGRRGSSTFVMVRQETPAGHQVSAIACVTADEASCDRARYTLEQPANRLVLNSFGAILGLLEWRLPTRGLYLRGQTTGTSVGVLSLFVLRYEP